MHSDQVSNDAAIGGSSDIKRPHFRKPGVKQSAGFANLSKTRAAARQVHRMIRDVAVAVVATVVI